MPAAIRARRKWIEGTTLVAVETPSGLLLTERAEAERLIRSQLAGHDLVGELLDDRRAEAVREG